MAAYEGKRDYYDFIYDLHYDIYWLTDEQQIEICKIVKKMEGIEPPTIDGFYYLNIWELEKKTVEAIAKKTQKYKNAWEKERQKRNRHLTLAPLPMFSQPSTSTGPSTSGTQPTLPKLLIKTANTAAGKPKFCCQIKDEAASVVSNKRKSDDAHSSKENKRPRCHKDGKLKKMGKKKSPKVSPVTKEDVARLDEQIQRAKAKKEERRKKEKAGTSSDDDDY